MARRVLLVCRYFAPDNSVAAIRPTKIGKYLERDHDCIVDVLKLKWDYPRTDPLLQDDRKRFQRILEVPQIQIRIPDTSELVRSLSAAGVLVRKASSLVLLLRSFLVDLWNARTIARFVAKHLREPYDVVLSTSGPLLAHYAASRAKTGNAVWIADFRDPEPTTLSGSLLLRTFSEALVRHVVRRADAVTGVSEQCIRQQRREVGWKCRILPNGFDEDDLRDIVPHPFGKRTFAYTGTLYPGRSDFQPLFEALHRLRAEPRHCAETFQVVYAGRSPDVFADAVSRGNAGAFALDLGNVDRAASLSYQRGADALVLLSWNEKGREEIVTAKVYEYMMSGRPILCIVSGPLPGSRLKAMVEEYGNGFCYEEASREQDFPELVRFVDAVLSGAAVRGPAGDAPASRDRYRYERIAGAFLDLADEARAAR